MDNILLIFAKNAIPGTVKTRLAKTMGDQRAMEIYLELRDHTLKQASGVECNRWLCYSRHIPDPSDPRERLPADRFEKHVQHGEDLGQRMSNMFDKAFESGAKKVIIIGTDCPDLDSDLLQNAFDQLDTKGSVIGPAKDGGYYLLGLKKSTPTVFEGITWSTETVAAETQKRLAAAGLSIAQLPTLSDVDYEEDLG